MSNRSSGISLTRLGSSLSQKRTCLHCHINLAHQACIQRSRNHTSSTANLYEPKHYREPRIDRPRWSTTPPQYTAPYRSKPPVEPNDFPVNEDPKALDAFYEKIFGAGGHRLLTEEVKWLAVTHKSFDQGKRGYNERLAVLGRTILGLQVSLALVHSGRRLDPDRDQHYRQPFKHPALEGVENLMWTRVERALSKDRLSNLAIDFGLHEVVRWKPLKARDMKDSGQMKVLGETMFAIVGALTLEQGAIVANDIAREQIIRRLLPQ